MDFVAHASQRTLQLTGEKARYLDLFAFLIIVSAAELRPAHAQARLARVRRTSNPEGQS